MSSIWDIQHANLNKKAEGRHRSLNSVNVGGENLQATQDFTLPFA